ncbi:hypothetical protein O0582_002069 [Staphylococcus pseudintermedius]|nr:hypothetical protein [Staphylococcus pseudintermedius]
MLSPQLQIYNYVFKKLQGYGASVIGVKDIKRTIPYPFYMVQRSQNTKSHETLDMYSGNISLMIHLYSLADDELKHDKYLGIADKIVSSPFNLDGYQVVTLSVDFKTLIDNTTNACLLHSVLTVEFKVY